MISASSTLSREPLVVQSRQVRSGPRGRITRVRSVLPSKQANERFHHAQIFQQSFSVPPNLFTSGGAKATVRLEAGQFTRMKSFALTFTVSYDKSVKLIPASHWLERISIFTSGGSKHAQDITSEGIEVLYNAFEHERLRAALSMANSDYNWTTSVTRSGPGTLTVTIPLPVTYMSNSFQDLDNVGDTLIHLYPRTTINTALSHLVMPVCPWRRLRKSPRSLRPRLCPPHQPVRLHAVPKPGEGIRPRCP